MSKCENCIHNEVCKWWQNGDGKHILNCTDEVVCECFKDKSLCVELKCKLGQIVYVIVSPEKINEVKVKQIEIEPCEDKTYVNYRVGTFAWFFEEEIGKTAFLTKEEAEAKLREVKNG